MTHAVEFGGVGVGHDLRDVVLLIDEETRIE
jgi:hypothetical protein